MFFGKQIVILLLSYNLCALFGLYYIVDIKQQQCWALWQAGITLGLFLYVYEFYTISYDPCLYDRTKLWMSVFSTSGFFTPCLTKFMKDNQTRGGKIYIISLNYGRQTKSNLCLNGGKRVLYKTAGLWRRHGYH